jgi:hypothetical protein
MAAGHQSPRSCFLALLLPPLTVLSAAAASYETETIHPGLVVMTLPQPVSGPESFTSPTRTWACSGRRRAAASRAEAGCVLFVPDRAGRLDVDHRTGDVCNEYWMARASALGTRHRSHYICKELQEYIGVTTPQVTSD